jgi:hypothetical protein
MTQKFAQLSILAITLLLAGCMAHKPLAGNDAPLEGESVLVVGMGPGEFELAFEDAEVTEGRLEISPFRMVRVVARPNDNYVVARVPGGKTLAMSIVNIRTGEGQSRRFIHACGGMSVSVVTVPPNKVLYFGDISVSRSDVALPGTTGRNAVRLSRTNNLAMAKNHLLSNHKNIAERLEPASVVSMPLNRTCAPSSSTTTTIPIYIPAPRR